MAKFYIQLQDKLLQISGDLTAENISKALGYVPVSPNVTNELSQRVDNITFDSLKDNPFLQDGSGELNIVDEAGNIIAKIDADGIHSVDFIAGDHRLSDKTDKTYVDEAVKNVKVNLTGYATEEYVNNIDFYNINNNPIVNNGDGKLLFVDENGYIGLQLEENGLYVKDVIADGHTLSQKADKSELPTKTSDLTNDSGFITVNEIPEVTVPTKVSELENDKGYITASDVPEVEIPSLDGYVKSEDLPNFDEFAKTEDIPEIPSLDGYATEEWVNNKNYATEYELKTIDYSSINNVPTLEDETGELTIADESGNIGMKVASEAVYAKDFIAGEHKLSEKQDIITDIEDIRRGASKGDNSGVFVKFNELFAEGTLTTNESDVFNVVKTAMESNTPLLLCDNNYSVILVSHYPLKVGNTIIASGTLSLDVYNFTFTSGSNQITVTKLSVATLSDNLVSALGLKSPLGKSYALPDADAADWADACLLSTEDGISRFLEYPNNHVGYLEGFFDEPAGNVWALPNSDLSVELGLEYTLASRGEAPSYYILNNSVSPSTLELMGDSAPTKQEPGNIIAVMFSESFQQDQGHEFVIEGNAWMLPEDAAVLANGGETMLFVFSSDYIVPVGAYESFYAKKAEVLQTSRTINGVYFNGSSNITNYTTCSTAAATAAKTVTIDGFRLLSGAQVRIKFTNANTASSPTLNVSNTGAKSIYYNGLYSTSFTSTSFPFDADKIYTFTYNGTYWVLEGDWLNTVTATSTSANYPLILGPSASAGATITSGDKMLYTDSVNSLYYNPSTNILFAPNLQVTTNLKFPAPNTTYPSANIGMGAKPTGTYNGLVLYNAGGSNSDKDFINIIGETHVWKTDGTIGTVFANISGNAASATALETPRTINRMTFDGSANVSNYVVCSTAAGTVPKVINIPNMTLGPDARIWIEFTNGNTYLGSLAASVTHINGTTQTFLNFYGCTGQQPTGSGNTIHYKSIVIPAGVYEFVYYNANLYFTGNYVSEKKPYIVVGSSVASANTPTIALNHTLHTVVNLSNPRALTFTVSDSSMVHDYSFEFKAGTTKPTVTFPSAWKWANGTAPTISANKTYHVSVVNNCAVIAEF